MSAAMPAPSGAAFGPAVATHVAADPGGRPCPACGLENADDAVFCANAACHKALGEFGYAPELVAGASSVVERAADRVTRVAGHPHFVTAHLAWFAGWLVVNSGVAGAAYVFDAYPYGLLGLILAIEAALVTSCLLVSNNRQNVHSETRAELEYEVNVRAWRLLQDIERRLERLERPPR